MSKRSRADSHLEAINLVFETLFAITNTSKPEDDVTLGILKNLKHRALSAAAEEEEFIRKAAKEFTLDEAVQDFGLTYSSKMSESEKHWWKIEALPDVKTFQPSSCLGKSFSLIFLNRAMTGGLTSVASGKLHWNLRSIK